MYEPSQIIKSKNLGLYNLDPLTVMKTLFGLAKTYATDFLIFHKLYIKNSANKNPLNTIYNYIFTNVNDNLIS